MTHRVLVVRPSRNSFVLAPLVLLFALMALDMFVVGLLMLDPRWHGEGGFAILRYLPNYLRSAILVVLAGLFGFFCLGFVRLLASDRIAVLTQAGADFLTLCGWQRVAWSEVKEIDVVGWAPFLVVQLVRASPDPTNLVFPLCSGGIRVGGISDTSKQQVLDFIAGVRPDLVPAHAKTGIAQVGQDP